MGEGNMLNHSILLKNMTILASAMGLMLALPTSSSAHIDLLEPTPLLDGRAGNFRSLKVPPFGAPDIDVASAPAHTVNSGSIIHLEVDHYIYHPGEIVVLYTTDMAGADVMPVMSIPEKGAEVPHHNLLYRGAVPTREEYNTGQKTWRADVQLPDIEGTIILVVRQLMHDKFDDMPDGSVSLSRIYYHQGAKLNLVRD